MLYIAIMELGTSIEDKSNLSERVFTWKIAIGEHFWTSIHTQRYKWFN